MGQALEPHPHSYDAPKGNVYDKYDSGNPLSRALVSRFRASVDVILDELRPASHLDCGCGEGVLTHGWALQRPGARVVGIDLDDPDLREHWDVRSAPNLEYRSASVTSLPYLDGEFELVSGIEVLEHVPDPDVALAEMRRVARDYVLVSVPREPLWRALNLARGSYVREWGNTPGHVNHWSRGGFVRLVEQHGRLLRVDAPLPWTIALIDVRIPLGH